MGTSSRIFKNWAADDKWTVEMDLYLFWHLHYHSDCTKPKFIRKKNSSRLFNRGPASIDYINTDHRL